MGNVINRIEDKEHDTFHIVEKNSDGEWQRTGSTISFAYGIFSFKDDAFVSSVEGAGAELFKFLSDNTIVEFGMITTLSSKAIVFTDSDIKSINLYKKAQQLEINGETVTQLLHSHPNNTIPSGYIGETKGDKFVAGQLVSSNGYLVEHYVYNPKYNLLTQYDKDSIIGVIDYYLIFGL